MPGKNLSPVVRVRLLPSSTPPRSNRSNRLTPETFAQTKALTDAAIALHRDELQHLTAPAVCERAEVDEADFHAAYSTPRDLLPAFYSLVIDQYHFLCDATEGYDQFLFEERLASFFFIVLDTLGEQRAFVLETFDTSIRRESTFRADVRAALRDLLASDDIPNSTQLITGLWPVHEVLTTVTFAVIRFWIDDDSEQQQATTALVDKLVAFIAELVTFRGVQRGTDLAWYLVQSDALGLKHLPLVGRLLGR